MRDRAYEIARNPRYDGFQRSLASVGYSFLDKKTPEFGATSSVNDELAQELHKPVFIQSKRKRVYARFKDNIWAADLGEKESLSSESQGVKYLLCVIDIFTKYGWVKPLNDRKGKRALNTFIEIENESHRQPKKIWVDQGRKDYDNSM